MPRVRERDAAPGVLAEREFAYTAGAEAALARAGTDGWTVVSVRDDGATVHTDEP